MLQYLDTLGLVLSTVPSQHTEPHQLLSAGIPRCKRSYSWSHTETLLRTGNTPCSRGQDSPVAHTLGLKEKHCLRLGTRRARFFFRRDLVDTTSFLPTLSRWSEPQILPFPEGRLPFPGLLPGSLLPAFRS